MFNPIPFYYNDPKTLELKFTPFKNLHFEEVDEKMAYPTFFVTIIVLGLAIAFIILLLGIIDVLGMIL